MDSIYLLITTVASAEEAKNLAQKTVENGLAACAQVQATCHSVYKWQGKLESATEYPIHFKTNESKKCALFQFIKEQHSYDVPEIISLKLDDVDPMYATWLNAQLATK
ncbi:divalent-cation tolerance protein CutA [Polynucleobacter victoriensis]|uniref:Divalent cation tolerance protein n=1 Tax=Polynucleobacter victoriensis TaxID=2049319 RepID=A0A212TBL4_9BURK|nr:divalent-cation tolerance protein CutA [Polynucleobacter victoriensis]SNC63250.1 divalent cation tolerance protein [Polynucleobacter victoriensis]